VRKQTIHKGYKTELDLNNKQQTQCRMHAGTSRFAYNWALARRKELYDREKASTNAIELHRELNKLKKTDYPWMYEVSKCAPQEALRDLDKAYTNFFKGRARYPKFKSKKRGIGSFRLTGAIKVFGKEKAIQLPRLGKLRLKEKGYLPATDTEDAHILSATVSEKAGRWFVSIQVEEEIKIPENNGPPAGVDLGIKQMMTVSDGAVFENPKALSHYERKIKRQNRSLARKKKRSNNREKAKIRLQKTYARVTNIRRDAQHKATTWLAKNKSVIGVEDLNVSGMLKNGHLSKAISDVGFGELKRQLEYKTKWYGSTVIVADRFYPSSKTCSVCGYVKDELSLSERTFVCNNCGSVLDRDLNASRNLENLAVSWTESLNACKSGELWPSDSGGETAFNEAGIEHYSGRFLNG